MRDQNTLIRRSSHSKTNQSDVTRAELCAAPCPGSVADGRDIEGQNAREGHIHGLSIGAQARLRHLGLNDWERSQEDLLLELLVLSQHILLQQFKDHGVVHSVELETRTDLDWRLGLQ